MSNTICELNNQLKNNPKLFFDSLGGLHDAEILELNYNLKSKNFYICIDDLYANFVGLQEYKDIKNIKFIFNVIYFESNLDFQENYKYSIYDVEVEEENIKIMIAPSGYIKINVNNIKLM